MWLAAPLPSLGLLFEGFPGGGRDVVQPARALACVRRLSVFTLIPHRAVLDGTPVFCLISRLRFSQFLFRVLGLRTNDPKVSSRFHPGRKSGGTQVNTNDVVISSNDDGRGKNDASRDKDRKKARMEKRA